MLKFIHLTDTHLVGQGVRLYGLDPHQRLKQALADINKHHGDAHSIVITGDLTNWGGEDEYQALADALALSRLPVRLILGNHDHRARFRNAFPDAMADENGYVQDVTDTDFGRMIFLDTLMEGTHAGWLCEERLNWLGARLKETGGPVYLFMHHPPFDIGMPGMDQYGLIQKEEFKAVIHPYKSRIRQIFFGHIHRPIHGEWLGIPFSTLRGTNHQVWMDLEGRADGNLPMSYERPAYGVVLIDQTITLIHEHDYLYDDEIYLGDPPEGLSEYDYATTGFDHHE
ncbi:phosphodiesterase [Aestuariispira insulae]|uniref:Diethylphosphate phosphodiesterase n=1 Tax=Aestuariispira insulae TaxID=1461337 RepID=A0A3D9H6R7_9PROT|nr:phosphodiesterase [Aestuariispira insulae]RED44841.1 diethylphosphate phosphodiesterase [Aestuariispira insulae]